MRLVIFLNLANRSSEFGPSLFLSLKPTVFRMSSHSLAIQVGPQMRRFILSLLREALFTSGQCIYPLFKTVYTQTCIYTFFSPISVQCQQSRIVTHCGYQLERTAQRQPAKLSGLSKHMMIRSEIYFFPANSTFFFRLPDYRCLHAPTCGM